MPIKSLQILNSGCQTDCDKGFFTFQVDGGKKVDSPFLSYLLKADEGNILVDTGMHPDDAKIAPPVGGPFISGKGDLLPSQLKSLGLSLKDINLVIMTHLHWDHCGWLNQLSNAEVIVQDEEHRFAINPSEQAKIFYFNSYKYTSSSIKWRKVDGDEIIIPGLTVLFTPGHTPGCQSVMVDLPKSGTILLVGDAGFLQENFQKEIIPVPFGSPRDALLSIKRLNVWSQSKNAKIFTTHDMEFWHQQMRKSPEFYN